MECKLVTNLLDNTPNQPSKNCNAKVKLCDYNDACILVKGAITIIVG